MAILQMDQKNLQIKVMLNSDESFRPDEELEAIEKEAVELRKDYNLVAQKMGQLLEKLNQWNKKNSTTYKKNIEEQAKKVEEKKE